MASSQESIIDQAAILQRYAKVQKFVHGLCSNFITNETLLNAIVTEDPNNGYFMLSKYWNPAFTHVTANPSNGKNNEVLENVGDSILDGQFTIFLTRRLPEGSELMFTELGNTYTGNEYLAGRCDELGLASILLTQGVPEPTEGMKADVVEAFIGALVMSGNALADGLGSALAYEFVVYMFKDVQIDVLKGEGAPRTKVEQIFTRFGYNPPPVEYTKQAGVGTASVYLLGDHINFLQTAQFNIPSSNKLLIGSSQDKDKDKAKTKAFESALRYLRERGVTPAWAEDLKNAKEMSAPEVRRYLPAALKRAGDAGFVSMYFSAPGKASTEEGFTILLVGVLEDGTRDTLHAKYFTYSENRRSDSKERELARAVVIREYAEGI